MATATKHKTEYQFSAATMAEWLKISRDLKDLKLPTGVYESPHEVMDILLAADRPYYRIGEYNIPQLSGICTLLQVTSNSPGKLKLKLLNITADKFSTGCLIEVITCYTKHAAIKSGVAS